MINLLFIHGYIRVYLNIALNEIVIIIVIERRGIMSDHCKTPYKHNTKMAI